MRNGELRLATVLFGVALALGGCQEDGGDGDGGGAADSG
ncbi:MAG: cellulose 1,4-beta-cellobiosidase, partial [Myxococcales bacterium]|nr:cellulose 1,4-beta-cellobiosidase [Myxococcales bacterium]